MRECFAFVVGAGGELTRVELGPADEIAAAVDRWREALLAPVARGIAPAGTEGDAEREAGELLRALLLDPLRPVLGAARRLVVAPDLELHCVPFDALPLGEGRVGDEFAVELRISLRELLDEPVGESSGSTLVALGGVSYFGEPRVFEAELLAREDAEEETDAPPGEPIAMLRGSQWERGFPPLPMTGSEARAIAALCEEVLEDVEPVLLEKRAASRESLELLAPRARWLHLATHGWFSPESVASDSDRPNPGALAQQSREELVRGSSPMVLCGVALAGANRPADSLGRIPGLITAEEISTWDLSGCELAVLSACETNVGVRRAGQGVASLQKALQMAGAQSVITSLWKVPDEATRELMVDFYRRLWFEKKPKHQALWEAKNRLRHARDPSGRPIHAVRDWAGWVLSGDPE